jgi:hypothetical protein
MGWLQKSARNRNSLGDKSNGERPDWYIGLELQFVAGPFFLKTISAKNHLRFYATQFSTTELNGVRGVAHITMASSPFNAKHSSFDLSRNWLNSDI